MTGRFILTLVCGLSIWMNVTDLRSPPAVQPPPPQPQVIDVDAEVLPPDAPRQPPDRTA
jgi:hypothetical protein